MIGKLSILTTSFIPGLAIADGITGAAMNAVMDTVVPTAFARVPEPGLLPLLAAAGVAAIAVKIIRRNK